MFRQIIPALRPKGQASEENVVNQKDKTQVDDAHLEFIPLRSKKLVPRKYVKKQTKKISRYQENLLLGKNMETVQENDHVQDYLGNISPISFTLSDFKSSAESAGNSLTSLNLDKESLSLSDICMDDYESLSKLVSSQDLEDFLLFEQNDKMSLE
jgi:hypothetical protein